MLFASISTMAFKGFFSGSPMVCRDEARVKFIYSQLLRNLKHVLQNLIACEYAFREADSKKRL